MMWPFIKKQLADNAPTAQDLRNAEIGELQTWRPVGSKLHYLGRTLVVTGHWLDKADPYYLVTIKHPGLCADYADDHGVLHSITFSMAEARALMVAQP